MPRRNSLPCLGLPGREIKGLVVCYLVWVGTLDKRKVRGLFPRCGQYGYRAQVLQHPIDLYRYISHVLYNKQL